MKGVLIVSHGSQYEATRHEVRTLVTALQSFFPDMAIDYAFLDCASPSIPEGLASLTERGVEQIFVALNFLNSGRHVDKDIPRLIEEFRATHPTVHIALSFPVGQHPGIPSLFKSMIQEWLNERR